MVNTQYFAQQCTFEVVFNDPDERAQLVRECYNKVRIDVPSVQDIVDERVLRETKGVFGKLKGVNELLAHRTVRAQTLENTVKALEENAETLKEEIEMQGEWAEAYRKGEEKAKESESRAYALLRETQVSLEQATAELAEECAGDCRCVWYTEQLKKRLDIAERGWQTSREGWEREQQDHARTRSDASSSLTRALKERDDHYKGLVKAYTEQAVKLAAAEKRAEHFERLAEQGAANYNIGYNVACNDAANAVHAHCVESAWPGRAIDDIRKLAKV